MKEKHIYFCSLSTVCIDLSSYMCAFSERFRFIVSQPNSENGKKTVCVSSMEQRDTLCMQCYQRV